MNPRDLFRALLQSFVFVCVTATLSMSAMAQKKPIALQSTTSLSAISKAEYEAVATSYRGRRNEQDRNRLIYMAISQIDLNFRDYQRKRRIGRDLFETVMDILEVGAVAAVSITNGVRSKAIINDGLAFLKGSRASVNKNLRLLDLQILFNKMREDRAVVMQRILDNVDDPIESYPFERAYMEIVDYYIAGTMDNALSSLASETGKAADKAESDLERKKIL